MPLSTHKSPCPQTSADKRRIFAFPRQHASGSSASVVVAKRKDTKDLAEQAAPCKRHAPSEDKSIDIVEGLSTSTKDVETNTHDDGAQHSTHEVGSAQGQAVQASPAEVGEEKDTTAADIMIDVSIVDTMIDASIDYLDGMSDRSGSETLVMSPAVPAAVGDEPGGPLDDPGGEDDSLQAWLSELVDEEDKDFVHAVLILLHSVIVLQIDLGYCFDCWCVFVLVVFI